MSNTVAIHLFASLYALITGAVQLAMPKGTRLHKYLGRSWMFAMLVTSISSFWINSFYPLWYHLGAIHLLSVWVIFCVIMSTTAAIKKNIKSHKAYALGSYIGLLGAGIGTFFSGRYIHQLFF